MRQRGLGLRAWGMWFILLAAAPVLFAASGSWNTDADGNWNVNGNWTGATFPNATTDNATLGNVITADRTITLGQNITVRTLTVNDDNKYTITGANTLILSLTGTAFTQSGSGAVQIDSNVRIDNDMTWTGAGAGIVTVNGIISEDGGTTDTLTKTGAFTLVLNGANTFAGGLTVNGGTVEFGNNGANGTGTLTLTSGTIQAGGGARTINEAVTVSGNFGVGGSNDLTLSGNMALGAAVRTITVNNTGNTTFSGVVSGAGGGITKSGSGTLTLSGAGANTYTGATTVNDGTLVLNKTAGVNAFAGTLTIGDATGAADSAVVRLNANNQIPTVTVTIRSDGLLDLNNNSDTIGALSMTGGHITTGTGTLTLGGNVTGNASASTATISGNLALGANRTFTIANGAADPDMDISATVSGGFNVIKAGAGNLQFSGNNTYTGTTTISAGTLTAASNNALGTAAGGTTVASGATLAFAGGINYTTAEAVTVSGTGVGGNGAIYNASGDNSFSGAITMAANSTFGAASGTTLTLNGAIGQSGGVRSLTKAGTGTMTINAASTFTGTTTINAGTLEAAANNALGSTSSVTLNSGGTLLLSGASSTRINNAATIVMAGGTFDANNATETMGALSLTADSNLNLSADGTGGTLTFASGSYTGGTLYVNNWTGPIGGPGTDDRIFITANPGSVFFDNILFTGLLPGGAMAPGYWLATGEIVPLPEPGTVGAGVLLALLMAAGALRRMKRSG